MVRAIYQRRYPQPASEKNDTLIRKEPELTPEELIEARYPSTLRGWAALNSLENETSLLLVSVLLAQIAGPALSCDGFHGLSGTRAPSILAADSDAQLQRAAHQLMSPLLALQEGLVLGSREFRRQDVNQYFHSLKRANVTTELKRFEIPHHEEGSPHFYDLTSYSLEDRMYPVSHFGDAALRREKIVHPVFALVTLPEGALAKPLSDCHLGHGLMVAVSVRLSNDHVLRHRRLDEICRLLEGAETVRTKDPVEPTRQARMGGVFLFRQGDLRWIFENHEEALRRMIPASSGTTRTPEPADAESADKFRHNFESTALKLLAFRRDLTLYQHVFKDNAAKTTFQLQRAEFIRTCAGDATNLTMLPDLLLWGLVTLNSFKLDEAAMVGLAMHAARKIRANAGRTVFVHRQLEQSRIHQERAVRMLERLGQRGPLKRHELIRCFDVQRMDVHRPVIDRLLELGFIREDMDKRLYLAESRPGELTRELFQQALP